MVNQQLTLSTIVCALLFSCGSVASMHISAQSLSSQSATLRSSESSTDSDFDMVAAIDSAMFNGMADSNTVKKFALQVSGFQHESSGDLSSSVSRSGGDAGYLPRVDAGQNGLIKIIDDNNGARLSETGTLLLVTLGFAALAISRRRIKFAHAASGQAANANPPAANHNASAGEHELKSAQHRQFAGEQLIPGGARSASEVEQPTKISDSNQSTANTTTRNPYPELAHSVQELEALAHEMAQLS